MKNNEKTFTFAEILLPPKYDWFTKKGLQPECYANHLCSYRR